MFHPYLSIHSLDEIRRKEIRSYLIGATNQLFRQEDRQQHHFILLDRRDERGEDREDNFIFLNSQLKSDLQLTIQDRRFTQLFFQTSTSLFLFLFLSSSFFSSLLDEVKSEAELRDLFTVYLLSLLSVASNPSWSLSPVDLCSSTCSSADQSLNDFNSSYVKCFQETDAFRLWIEQQDPTDLQRIPPKSLSHLSCPFISLFFRHPLAGQFNVDDVKLRVAQ